MGFFKKILRRNEPDITDDRFYSPLIKQSSTGMQITPEVAMRSSAVLGCVRVLSETMAMLPLLMYLRESDTKRKRETTHPLYRLLHNKPNRWQTSFEFREMMMGHCLLRGNAYAQKVYTKDQRKIIELVPLNPTRMQPKLSNEGEVEYHYTYLNGVKVIFPQDKIFHLKGMGDDGLQGISVISYSEDPVGIAIATQEYQGRFFSNDASPGGVITHPSKMSDKAYQNLKKSWSETFQGIKNSHKAAILEEGMQWKTIGMTSVDAQLLENRRFQTEEIARIFRVPLHLIQDLQRATFSNIESQDMQFVKHTILPWCKRWEDAIQARILDEKESTQYYFEFLVDGLLRGDFKTRQEGLSVMRNNGIINADEWRALENMNPQDNDQGSVYLVPANMVNAAHADKMGPPNSTDNQDPKDEPKDNQKQSQDSLDFIKKQGVLVINDRLSLIESKEEKAFMQCLKKEDWKEHWESFLTKHRDFLSSNLETVVKAHVDIELFIRDITQINDSVSSKVTRSVLDKFIELRIGDLSNIKKVEKKEICKADCLLNLISEEIGYEQ